ncbi:MAG: antitoxin VbhA family protein [Pseudomonadota bacterium]
MIAEQENIERRAGLRRALTGQRLEGLEPATAALRDAQRWAAGEITCGEAIANRLALLRQDMA